MAIVSCKEKKGDTPTDTHGETSIEVTTPVAEEVNTNGTAISVSTDGVNISTKDGAKQTSVSIKDSGAKVEIKK